MIQRNLMIPGIRWSLPISLECNKRLDFWIWFIFMASTYGSTDPLSWYEAFDDLKEISIGRMDFDNPKVYSDTSISDGLVIIIMILISYVKMSSPTHIRTDKSWPSFAISIVLLSKINIKMQNAKPVLVCSSKKDKLVGVSRSLPHVQRLQ